MNNEPLDTRLNFDKEHEEIAADPELIRRAHLWALLGGIGGIVLGHKLAHSNRFVDGRFLYIYDEDSRREGKKAQRTGLFIWIPLYIVFIIAYNYWLINLSL